MHIQQADWNLVPSTLPPAATCRPVFISSIASLLSSFSRFKFSLVSLDQGKHSVSSFLGPPADVCPPPLGGPGPWRERVQAGCGDDAAPHPAVLTFCSQRPSPGPLSTTPRTPPGKAVGSSLHLGFRAHADPSGEAAARPHPGSASPPGGA